MKRYLLILSLLAFACGEVENPVPNYPVYLDLDLTFEDKALRDVPSSKTYTLKNININTERVGFGGVLVVHASDGLFYAFDMACPYEASRSAIIEADANTLYAVCPKCGTKYDIGFGSGAPDGIGKDYLRRYIVTGADPRLTVRN
ncbi:MAG: (2Fe-2S)-binding protein [Tannerella sp.]|jgi:nitrite reductase/ring-hydroxylating ferredoxin subunit|nr:(2Fe-2S)-binding protein [Tannerella sp.]